MERRFVGVRGLVIGRVVSGCTPEKACEAYDATRKKGDDASGKATQPERVRP